MDLHGLENGAFHRPRILQQTRSWTEKVALAVFSQIIYFSKHGTGAWAKGSLLLNI